MMVRPIWKRLLGIDKESETRTGGEVLDTGIPEEEVRDTIAKLDDKKTELEAQLARRKSRLNTLVEQARENPSRRDELLREIRRLRKKAEAVKERRDDIFLKLEAWEEVIGTHEIGKILGDEVEGTLDLGEVSRHDLEGRMKEIADERWRYREKAESFTEHAKEVRDAGIDLDLSEEREAVNAGVDKGEESTPSPEKSLEELEEEIQRLEKEEGA